MCHPIYDWESNDIWVAIVKFDWDYNGSYDVYNQTHLHGRYLAQRVSPPFGEEPLRGLHLYQECYPEMWAKMIKRVKGVATANRYANSPLYGYGSEMVKPDGITNKQMIDVILDTYAEPYKSMVIKSINSIVKRHYAKTDMLIEDEVLNPLTGTSWQFIAKIALKGDFKGRTSPKLENAAIKAQKALGINSYYDAIMKYGNTATKMKAKRKAK
jgi:predicted phosphoadenosine phosphosulfate sulfurtransferase